MKPSSRKKYVVGALYAALNPIQVWCGYELGVHQVLVSLVLIGALMVIEGWAVVWWFEGQADEINARGTLAA